MLPAAYCWSLTGIGIAAGIAMLLVFRRFAPRRQTVLARRKLRAQLYAIRLYAGEPVLVARAQGRLLVWCGRYLALMLRPVAVMIVPGVALLLLLGDIYGRRPLAPGETAIVTAQFGRAAGRRMPDLTLEGRGVAVETPAVRLTSLAQACWRVRVTGDRSGRVVLHVAGDTVVRSIACGSGLHYLYRRRYGWPLRAGVVRWIEVSYPHVTLDVFGYGLNWLIWFLAVDLLTMLALRKRFNVIF